MFPIIPFIFLRCYSRLCLPSSQRFTIIYNIYSNIYDIIYDKIYNIIHNLICVIILPGNLSDLPSSTDFMCVMNEKIICIFSFNVNHLWIVNY